MARRTGSGFWSQRVSWPRVAFTFTFAVVATTVILGFFMTGHAVMALIVLVCSWAGPGVYGIVQRRRQPKIVWHRHHESTVLPWPAQTVWDLIYQAEKAPLLNPTVRLGYRVPGTFEGVGERQAFEYFDGTTRVIEVVEWTAGHRAVTVQVAPEPEATMRVIFTVDPIEGGCVYTLGTEVEVRPGQQLRNDCEGSFRTDANTGFDRIRTALGGNIG
jgi:hypothetical protein